MAAPGEEDAAAPNFVLEMSARHIYEETWSRYVAYSGAEDVLVYSPVYSQLIKSLDELGLTPHVLNHSLYEWYLGNATSDFVVGCFMPYLNTHMDGVGAGGYFGRCLTPRQAHDAFCVLYMLVHKGGLSVKQRNYYGHTPLQQLAEIPHMDLMPAHLKELLPAFNALLKHGKELAVLQQACVRRFVARRKLQRMQEEVARRRREAVARIESWWFDIIASPFHPIGLRFLREKRAAVWQQRLAVTATVGCV